MGTETRIGIVAGLVIVVVASVYFFYGNHSEPDDLLITTKTRVTPPPTIPPDADRAGREAATRRNGRDSASPATRNRTADRRTPAPRRPAATPRAGDRGADRTPEPAGADDRESRRLALNEARPQGGQPKSAARSDAPLRTDTLVAPIVARDNADTVGRRSDWPESGADADSEPDRLRVPGLVAVPDETLSEAIRRNLQASESDATVDERAAGRPMPRNVPGPTPGQGEGTRRTTGVIVTDPPAALAPDRWPKRHTISDGDTLSDLAELYYGSGILAAEVLKANPQIEDPRRLRIGDVVTFPAPDQLQVVSRGGGDRGNRGHASGGPTGSRRAAEGRGETSGEGTGTYRVRPGDSFYSISGRVLGSSGRWKELFDLNKALVDNDPKRLRPGMILKLPRAG